MPSKEAKKWMKMCVDSGLWVPSQSDEFDGAADDEEEEGEDQVEQTHVE